MKPVAIFRFSLGDGPGYFATFLDRHSIPWELICLDKREPVPGDLAGYSGFVFMGGPMSANDDTPWNEPILALIRQAIQGGYPCLGHCLGGQLMSKALGGAVSVNPVKEIGWNPVRVEPSAEARDWLGDDASLWTTFQWHGDTFSIPPGATRILTGDVCANQAYVVANSLGMQCHTEMTPEAIDAWCADWAAERADPALPSVQTPAEIRAHLDENLTQLRRLGDRLYTRWIRGLSRED